MNVINNSCRSSFYNILVIVLVILGLKIVHPSGCQMRNFAKRMHIESCRSICPRQYARPSHPDIPAGPVSRACPLQRRRVERLTQKLAHMQTLVNAQWTIWTKKQKNQNSWERTADDLELEAFASRHYCFVHLKDQVESTRRKVHCRVYAEGRDVSFSRDAIGLRLEVLFGRLVIAIVVVYYKLVEWAVKP